MFEGMKVIIVAVASGMRFSRSVTMFEKLPYETHDIGLDLVVGTFHEELGHPTWPDTVVLAEVLFQDPDGLLGRRIAQQ